MQGSSVTPSSSPDESPVASASSSESETLSNVFSGDLWHAYEKLTQGNVTEAASLLLFKFALPAFGVLAALVVTYFVAKLISRWVRQALCRRVDETLGQFAGKIAFYVLLILGILAILQTAGADVTGFAAVMAAAGFAIGLAFQGTLSNFASGILLLVFRPFKVGDVVQLAGVLGKVNEIDLFTTALDTFDNRRLIVPNSAISNATIENMSFHAHRRVDVTVGVSYSASLDLTRQILEECAESLAEWRVDGDGRGYQVLLSNLGASSVDWTIRFWTETPNYFKVLEALTVEVKRQLDANSVEIPFPQMQLHFSQSGAEVEPESHQGSSLPIPAIGSLAQNGRSQRVRPRNRTEQP